MGKERLNKNPISVFLAHETSPARMLVIAILLVFLAELVIMFLLRSIPDMPMMEEAFFDATALSVLVIPVLYLLFFRPLMRQYLELKKADKELKLFRDMIDKLNDNLFIIDHKTATLLDVNDSACRNLGYSREELIGLRVIDVDAVVTDLSGWKNHVDELKKAKALTFESVHRRKDGSTFPVEINVKHMIVSGTEYMVALARDITARKQAELACDQFKGTLDKTLDCIFMFTPDTLKFFYVNKGAMEQVGYTQKELLTMTPLDIKPEFTESSFREMIAPMVGGKISSHTFETIHRRKDGKLIPVEIFIQYISSKGEQGRFVAIVRDITERKKTQKELEEAHAGLEKRVKDATAELLAANEYLRLEIADRKRAEAALRESEEKYRALIEMANDGVVIIQDMKIMYVNPRATQMIGFSMEEAVGQPFTNFIHQKELPKVAERYKKRMEGKEVPRLYETVLINKSGELLDVELNATIIEYSGKPADLVFIRDITDRKRAEEELREAHAETEQLLTAIHSILIWVHPSGRVARWNNAAEEVFGIDAESVVGKPFTECGINWNWTEISRDIARCKEDEMPVRIDDVPYIRRDGKDGFIGATFTPIFSDNGEWGGFLMLAAETTERKILESQLAQAQKLESIGQLAAGIAHEINTPTQYVGDNLRFFHDAYEDMAKLLESYSGLLQSAKKGEPTEGLVGKIDKLAEEIDLDYLREEIPKAIEQSLDGVGRVAKIVRAMKEFSHPGSEEKTAVDINKAIESTITVARNEWKYFAELETDFDPTLPLVPILPGDFNQVVLNMIVNAAHAIADVVGDGSQEKGKIKIVTRKTGDHVEIRISDTGAGIPEEIRHKVFDPFFTTKEVGKGTGQGLAISRNVVVDKHGGSISLESEEGKGATFIISLPLEDNSSVDD